MKQIFLIFSIFCVTICVSAQTDYSEYLNKVMEKLEAGDCDAAQKFYNVYKELSGETKSSVEVLIEDCKNPIKENISYAINDKIERDAKIFKVVYIEDKGKHGFAVCDMGSGPISEEMIKKRQLPTRSEMVIIRKNRNKIKLTEGDYWTMDRCSDGNCYYLEFFNNSFRCTSMSGSKGILLIYRF